MPDPSPFKWRHFQSDIILLNVRWYTRYPLSYRNLEEMMLERGIEVDHTTVESAIPRHSAKSVPVFYPVLPESAEGKRG